MGYMGIFDWFKDEKPKEKEINSSQKLETVSIPIYKAENKDKIMETHIRPVKIPTIVDIGEKLGRILKELEEIKIEMVSKSWLNSQYNDTNDISQKIDTILKKLESPKKIEKDVVKELSVDITKKRDNIIQLLSKKNKLTYSQIKNEIGVSDPTLSRRLKSLVKRNLIKREKKGRSVFYSI